MENVQEHWVKTHRDELFTVNQEEIRKYNLRMFKRLVLLCGGLMALMFIVVPFSAAKHSLLTMYFSVLSAAWCRVSSPTHPLNPGIPVSCVRGVCCLAVVCHST
jgi:hypothetical protein